MLFIMLLMTLGAMAQVKIGYFSYEKALHSMPAYTQLQADMESLRSQYDAEMTRVEKEFNNKYEEFLDGYSTYAKSIRQKRQTELQELMERNIAFRSEADRLLKEAEESGLVPLRQKLDETLKTLAEKFGYILLLNTDSNACPYINAAISEDVNALVQEALK